MEQAFLPKKNTSSLCVDIDLCRKLSLTRREKKRNAKSAARRVKDRQGTRIAWAAETPPSCGLPHDSSPFRGATAGG